jgi:hypothetical protein
VTLSQALVASYRLTQGVSLEPASGAALQLPRTVGLRGEYDCANCSDAMKEERGGCPYSPTLQRGTVAQLIDSTGSDTHDLIYRCPMGLIISNPALAETIETFHEAQASGGAGVWFGPPFSSRPRRIRRVWAVLIGAERRLEAAVRRARHQMDRR